MANPSESADSGPDADLIRAYNERERILLETVRNMGFDSVEGFMRWSGRTARKPGLAARLKRRLRRGRRAAPDGEIEYSPTKAAAGPAYVPASLPAEVPVVRPSRRIIPRPVSHKSSQAPIQIQAPKSPAKPIRATIDSYEGYDSDLEALRKSIAEYFDRPSCVLYFEDVMPKVVVPRGFEEIVVAEGFFEPRRTPRKDDGGPEEETVRDPYRDFVFTRKRDVGGNPYWRLLLPNRIPRACAQQMLEKRGVSHLDPDDLKTLPDSVTLEQIDGLLDKIYEEHYRLAEFNNLQFSPEIYGATILMSADPIFRPFLHGCILDQKWADNDFQAFQTITYSLRDFYHGPHWQVTGFRVDVISSPAEALLSYRLDQGRVLARAKEKGIPMADAISAVRGFERAVRMYDVWK